MAGKNIVTKERRAVWNTRKGKVVDNGNLAVSPFKPSIFGVQRSERTKQILLFFQRAEALS